MTTLSGFVGVGAAIVNGVLTEPLPSAGYARQPLVAQDLGGDVVTIETSVTLGPAAAAWDIGVVALFDAATAGTMIYSAAIMPVTVGPGGRMTIPPGTYAVAPGATVDPAVLTVGGAPLTFGGQPLRMM